jgi:hypothetical protein
MSSGLYVLLCALALVTGWTTATLVKRLPSIPPPGDPRRYLWAQVILYIGAFIAVLIGVLAKR